MADSFLHNICTFELLGLVVPENSFTEKYRTSKRKKKWIIYGNDNQEKAASFLL